MAEVTGYSALQARLHAIGSQGSSSFMRLLGKAAVAEQKFLVHRKTGNLGRTIHVGAVTPTSVETIASANYAAFVELGTRPHTITPRAKKALRWAASPAGRRLTGTPRKGAAVVFAKRVHHPGTKPYPFMIPGAKAAVNKTGLQAIVDAWNGAA
jgi:hypothetical protein